MLRPNTEKKGPQLNRELIASENSYSAKNTTWQEMHLSLEMLTDLKNIFFFFWVWGGVLGNLIFL